MTEFFRSWIMNIVSAIIFVVFVEMVITTEKFKKYVKLVTGLVLMIIIINPIVTLFNKDFSLDSLTIQSFNSFEQKDIQSKAPQLDDMKNAQIAVIFKQKLTEQVRDQILRIQEIEDVKASIVIDENPNSKTFGEIHEIEIISIKPRQKPVDGKVVQKVDIDISKKKVQLSEDIIQKVKEKLSNVYEIPNEKIYINTPTKGEY